MLTSMDICKRLRHSKGLGRKRTSDWESAIVLAALVAALAGPYRTIAADFMGSAAVSIASPLQAGFQEFIVFSGLTNPTALRFSPDGRVFVAEKRGVVKVFDSLTDPTPTIFADLRTKVHNYDDRGLLGLALPPNFPSTPYVYILYSYDAVIGGTAPRWGTPGQDSDPCPVGTGLCLASGRLSRLQASGNVMTGTEQVLINDWCQQFAAHSIGTLAFGPDGALYASAGDGGSAAFTDYGQSGSPPNPCGDPPVPAGGAQTAPSAQGGALRSQDLRTSGDPVTLDGTIIRINPETGAAMPNNPLISNSDPNARRIIAYGLRNPYRFNFRPGTHEIWIGDVGWHTWEEINRLVNPSDSTVENFGWPCYEGSARQSAYDGLNLTLCENLYAHSGAVKTPYFKYKSNTAIATGDTCTPGSSSLSGLAFYPGGPYPASYDGALFFSDYSRNCIWVMFKGTNGLPNPANIATFVTAAAGPVDLQIGPDGNLYYVDINSGTIRRIQFTGSTSTLPSPWLTKDIGAVAAAGSASYANGTFTVKGSGADISGTSDEFHYVYQPLAGNGVITARVSSLTNTNASAKAGVMIRETLNANAKYATTVITPGQGVSFQRRTSTGGSSTVTKLSSVTVPEWVRLKRSGSTLTAWHSGNGSTWTRIGSATVSMGTNVNVGLAVTSHNDGVAATAKFDNVRITKSLPPIPTISSPAASLTWKAGDTIQFSGTATDPEDGTLATSTLTWTIILNHCPSNCHTHTLQTFTGIASGSFFAPDHEYPSSLQINLTAKDSSGTESTASITLNPKTVALTLVSSPSGLRLGLNASTAIAPLTNTVIVNSQNSINAPTPQTLSGTTYVFSAWSDGGAASHNVHAPASATTYTVTFVPQTTATSTHEGGAEFMRGGDMAAFEEAGADQPAIMSDPTVQPGVSKTPFGRREPLTPTSQGRESSWPRATRIRLPGTANHAAHASGANYTAERIFTVNSTADAEDKVPGDGVCDAGGGLCTLRAALTESESSEDRASSPTAIHFDIPGAGVPTIRIREETSFTRGSLKALGPVIIDGTTQPAGWVELDGSAAAKQDMAGRDIVGLDLSGENSAVRGLVINQFPSHGIQLRPAEVPVQGNIVIEDNLIGTDVTGNTARPNGGDGVHLFHMSHSTIMRNLIMGNSSHGVAVIGADAIGNRLLKNVIRGHGGLGIALSDQANHLQEFPVLSSVTSEGNRVTIQGTFTSTPQTTFSLEFFANRACHPLGFGEGEDHIGSTEVTTDANGTASFTVALLASGTKGQFLTATATDPAGNTSEFSRCASMAALPAVVPFRALSATTAIRWGPRSGDDTFVVGATITRADGRKAKILHTEPLYFRVGTFDATLPFGALAPDQQGTWKFAGLVDGTALEVVIRRLGDGIFGFQARGRGADLTGTVNPLIVHLTIGDESGSTNIIADIK